MTTPSREEYAAAAEMIVRAGNDSPGAQYDAPFALAARVLRALAEGAVLCKAEAAFPEQGLKYGLVYRPLDPQP